MQLIVTSFGGCVMIALIGCSTGPDRWSNYYAAVNESQQIMNERPSSPEQQLDQANRLLAKSYDMNEIATAHGIAYREQGEAIRNQGVVRRRAATITLDAARGFQQQGNTAKAKEVYQNFIRTFVGGSYSGLREVAHMELGIIEKGR